MRLRHQNLCPRIHALPHPKKLLARITRERKRILFPKNPEFLARGQWILFPSDSGSFGNGTMVSIATLMLQTIGRSEQPQCLLRQCRQSIDVQLFLKLRTDVYYRLVTDVKLLGDAIVRLALS